MNQHFLSEMRSRLLEIQEEQERLLESLDVGFERALSESVGELSSLDQHTSDLGNETMERQKDLGFVAQARNTIMQCDNAIERLDAGTYGICETCDRPIGEARLEALPFASKCTDCQEAADADRAPWRPPEEDALSPPYGRSTYGDESIDRDDAWEIVARHGTANSPQDTPEAFDDDDDHIEKGPYGSP